MHLVGRKQSCEFVHRSANPMPLLSARVGRLFGRAVENLPAIDMIALFEVVDWSEDRGEVALRGMNSDPRALFL